MIIRKLEKADKFDAFMVSAICFHERHDDAEKERARVESDTTEDWGAFTKDGTLTSRIVNNKYDFYIDGTPVRTGGIGAVSTLPEYRYGGAVAEIFRELLPEAYRNGEVLSALYPFSHAFYRKQGYDTVTVKNEYELTPAMLECYRSDCEVHAYRAGEPADEYLAIYNSFAKGYNFAVPRDAKVMLKHIASDALLRERKFTYLFRRAGKAVSYVTFTDIYHDPAAILQVEECVWLDRDGFEAILAFLGRFDADYGSIRLPLPSGIDLLRIIRTRNAYDIRKTTEQGFMIRVINADELLRVIRKPADCDFTIAISDERIAQNNGTRRVRADSVERVTGVMPDIEVSERTFAQLATGCISLDEAMLKLDIAVHANEEMLRRVFTEKKIFINEHF